MGIINSNKTVSTERIGCDETFKVTLSLTAAPDILENPTDIVMVLDRSGSMRGLALANLKLGANQFIDIIDETTDGSQDGQIGGGSHIGIVSFAQTATQDTQLITSVDELKEAVDNLEADGSTNHGDAFTKAMDLFDPASANAKVIIMFTDGETTAGPDPGPIAAAARAAGITIYVIGLIGSDGIDEDALNDWASKPSASFVVITPDNADLEDIFADLAANISKPGATNSILDETVNADFEIVNVVPPMKGTVMKTSDRSLRWTIDKLGATATEAAVLEFYVKHVGGTSGVKEVNEEIVYVDAEENEVLFPNPTVAVDCGGIVPEGCPQPKEVTIYGCNDTAMVTLDEVDLQSQGRIIQINVRLQNVCPHKRVALAITVHEVDQYGVEHSRGMKVLTVPAHSGPNCKDVEVKCIKFILPDDLERGCKCGMCGQRDLKIRSFAHYIDTDFQCCEMVM